MTENPFISSLIEFYRQLLFFAFLNISLCTIIIQISSIILKSKRKQDASFLGFGHFLILIRLDLVL